jgi:crotonobetainyl-CoA:carnitine CoA-transferase CaiB-like acyl-CoA transferase
MNDFCKRLIVEGFRPGVVDKLGIGYAVVRAINPRIVYASITGYGQDGPWRQRAGHDINFLAISGVLDQIGCRGGAPALPNLQIGDLLGGALTPLVGLLAAVIGARTTGVGRYIDVAMTDAVLAHAVVPLLAVLATGLVAPRGDDMLSGGVPCYAVYATADERYLAVGALEPKFWKLFCATLACPDLVPYGLATGDEGSRVKSALARIIAAQPLAHWTALFAEVDCCVTPVLRLEETLEHEQILARQMEIEVDGVRQFAPPWKLSEHQFVTPRPAPPAGADSESILGAHGYTAAEIAALRDAKVI